MTTKARRGRIALDLKKFAELKNKEQKLVIRK